MKTPYLPCLLALAALALSGCETGRSARIQEKSAAYSMLSDEQKARVSRGDIRVGDDSDAVYIALGKPNSISTQKTDQGEVTVWTYKNFVVGEDMATRVTYNQPAQRGTGTPAQSGRTGTSISSTAPSHGTPQATPEAVAETITLLVDFRDNHVVALRSDL